MNSDDKTVLAVLFTLSAILFALGFWIRRWETAPRRWPQVSGTIVTSRVERGQKESRPAIEYEFKYQEQAYRLSHWRLGNYSSGSIISAEKIVSRYPVGQPVTVFVNVQEATQSVLEANPSFSWVAFGFGISFLAITVLVIFSFVLQARGR